MAACGDDEEEPPAGGGGGEQAAEVEQFPEDTTMGKIQEAGEIKIGVKYDVPPFGFKNPQTDKIEGFDVDLGQAIADKLGVEPNFIEAISDNRIPFLQDGTVDLVLSTMTINAERDQEIDFSEPYYVARGRILVPQDSDITGVDSLGGKKVCTALGSTYEETMKEQAPKADLRLVDSYSECLELVQNGAVDAVSTDDVILTGMIIQDDTLKLTEGEPLTHRAVRRRHQGRRHGVQGVRRRRARGVQERRRLGRGLREVGRPVHRRAAGAADDDARGGDRSDLVAAWATSSASSPTTSTSCSSGFWVTVRLVVFAFAIAMVVGTLVAALRIAPNKWLQRLGGVYVETFRNVPLLVLLFISFAGLRRAGVGHRPVGVGRHREPRPLHGRVRGRGAALRRVLGQQGPDRGGAVARIHVRAGAAAGGVPAGVPDRDLAARLADHRDDQELGDHRRLAARARRPAQDRARSMPSRAFQTNEAFFWAAVGYLMLTGVATLAIRIAREALRDPPMSYVFDPDNWEWLVTGNNVRFILEGFLVNLEIAVIAMVLSLIFGLALALARLSRWTPLSVAAGTWVDVWRNLPLIFIILYLALTIPSSWRDAYEDAIPSWFPEGLQSGRVLAAILGLVLYNSAVLAEIMRAGIQSLDRGQNEAARALGMSYGQSMRFVVLPQGLRRMVPATVSQLITLNKDTTLVSIVAIQEVMRHGRIVTGATSSAACRRRCCRCSCSSACCSSSSTSRSRGCRGGSRSARASGPRSVKRVRGLADRGRRNRSGPPNGAVDVSSDAPMGIA